ncbi:MAG: PTS sugar transporter subunit IIA [Candidatus Omnitrophica bacterium]|nr:PTS sugar transporter subunit IIA [Candidatus Omnitrophota bacterium]
MIDISQYVMPELIAANLDAANKEGAIRVLVEKVFKKKDVFAGKISFEKALEEVMAREKMQTTGLGQRVAFPHARIKGWEKFVVVIGINKKNIDFNSLDGLPVNFICLMISSTEEPYIILQTMSAIIRFLNETKYIDTLFNGMSAGQISEKFKEHNLNATKTIRAGDIMRPVKASVKMDSSVEDVTRIMHLSHLDIVPVIDSEGRICGQIACSEIFLHGIPEFFKHLNTVSFVRHIDPFEKYFKIKKELKARDIVVKDTTVISKDATLLEIVFELAVKNQSKLFVVDDGKLVGEIDRFSIIDKILFF